LSNPTPALSKALVLAAGRGERMRPLTDTTPKPLLCVKGVPLLSYHLRALQLAGHTDVAINTAWLEEKITQHYGDHFCEDAALPALRIHYSREGRDFGYALETAGGIARLLPCLDSAFWVLAGDIFIPGFEFSSTILDRFERSKYLAHLFLVPNPAHNTKGDFGMSENAEALDLEPTDPRARYTYSSIGLFKKPLFHAPFFEVEPGNVLGTQAALAPLLRSAMVQGLVSAELLKGAWTDVGTPERLKTLNSC